MQNENLSLKHQFFFPVGNRSGGLRQTTSVFLGGGVGEVGEWRGGGECGSCC